MKHKMEVDSVQLEFGQRRILSDVYLKCETGLITGLLGRNGQGKTCLMNVIYGSIQATSKSVRFDNESNYDAYKKPDLLNYLPQSRFIPLSLTLKRIFSDFEISFSDFYNFFPEFKPLNSSVIGKLSGGQRRLVEVYVILKSNSQFSMLDEPFTHIMPVHVEKMKEIIMLEKLRKGFLITDHLYRQIIDICDSVYVLDNCKIRLVQQSEDIEKFGYVRFHEYQET